MQIPLLKFLPVSGALNQRGAARRIAYWDWPCQAGADNPHVVIAVHGLTRQSRDFDVLAQALTPQARVLAVDVAGRGDSDWLADPALYQLPTYVADLAQLIEYLRAQNPGVVIDWVGTSMGGLIGLTLASQPAIGLRRLVLNDVGPVIQRPAMQRIAGYVGRHMCFDDELTAFEHMAQIFAGFGPHAPTQWAALCRPMLRLRNGRYCLHYDPAIGEPLRAWVTLTDEDAGWQILRQSEALLWAAYDAIACPTLLLRGADSDLLSRETADQMRQRGPHATCLAFPAVGHAPTLVADDQVQAVRQFLWREPAIA